MINAGIAESCNPPVVGLTVELVLYRGEQFFTKKPKLHELLQLIADEIKWALLQASE